MNSESTPLDAAARVGLVIPTIFSRPALLPLAVESLLGQSPRPELVIGAPKALVVELAKLFPSVKVVAEPEGVPLAEKINYLLRSLPESCELIGWLGDDDLLTQGSIEMATRALDSDPAAVMVYGGCDYIAPDGSKLFTNHSSKMAAKFLAFGPQLIPQPGALWRRSAFEEVGGLSAKYNLAFDFDLFLKLQRVGKLIHLDKTLAQFRWHPDSLSVKRRWVSVSEASKVRRDHYRGLMRLLWPIWEPFVMLATYLAGKLVSRRYLKS